MQGGGGVKCRSIQQADTSNCIQAGVYKRILLRVLNKHRHAQEFAGK